LDKLNGTFVLYFFERSIDMEFEIGEKLELEIVDINSEGMG